MKKIFFFLTIICISCTQRKKADLIVVNATVYTVDDAFAKAEAFAVKDGKFVAVGTSDEIKKQYTAPKSIDAQGKTIVPGLIDAHCHFYGLGLQQQKVDVTGTKSYDEVLQKTVDFYRKKKPAFVTGRGWDQNDWEDKSFPTNEKLNELFPEIPVALTRIDGHALLVNNAALALAGIDENTNVQGGEIIKKDGIITGVLIDNAMEYVYNIIPKPNLKASAQALKDAEEICFKLGLTTVDDAGLDRKIIELIDSLQQAGELKIRIYAMVTADEKNLDYYLDKGIVKTGRLNVRSFKVYGDGALGSRGAALREPYRDKPNHYGALVNTVGFLQQTAKRIAASDFQMNTHAIGDSANHIMLQTYADVLKDKKNRRWRIEHAQIVSPEDFDAFRTIIPSVQPTHATSDMYWAKDRVGAKRMKGAYAYKALLQQYGKVALGTDFPVEKVNPMLTFYAAVARKDLDDYPSGGFQPENALTREETLRGMTTWAAYANFEENEKGSIEVGKFADFIILNQDIMQVNINKVPKINIAQTFVNGERVK
ncbi:MAG TPA: amidohydrolase [Flavobacteriia bacterium]|nr:amidohydrolase [Flavobacteriia bacterium]